MTTLAARLEAIDSGYQLKEISELLRGARAHISFWGARMVTVGTSAKTRVPFNLNYLANKVLEAYLSRVQKGNLTAAEKTAGYTLVRSLKLFYTSTDDRLQRANFITRLFALIREYTFDRHSKRPLLDGPTALRQEAPC